MCGVVYGVPYVDNVVVGVGVPVVLCNDVIVATRDAGVIVDGVVFFVVFVVFIFLLMFFFFFYLSYYC